MNPELIVQRQLEAYNARDLGRFLAQYSDDIEAYRPPAGAPTLSGKAAFAEFYASNRFNKPALHADLLNRIVVGSRVIDHERISGVQEHPFEVAVAYQVENGLIRRTWTFAAS